jgi:thioredoxin:protein disulfide reductase
MAAISALIRIFVGILFALLLSSLAQATKLTPPETGLPILVAHVQLKDYQLNAGQGSEIKISLDFPDGYKAFEDQFRLKVLSPEGLQIGQLQISPLKEFFDKTTKRMRKGVIKTGLITVPFEMVKDLSEGDHELVLQLTYQACTDSFCLFPATVELKTPFNFYSGVAQRASTEVGVSTSSIEFAEIFQKGLLWTFIFVFLAGILTSFTPCIFPMIPITLSVLGRNAYTRGRLQNFLVSVLYVLGIAVTYSVMGVVAASTGALFGSFMAHPAVLTIMCLVFLAMALSMFGLFELHPPAFIQNRFSSSDDLTGYSGAFFSGIISGIVASPCVGPVLVGVLTYIAKSQNLVLGFFLMFTYALGMGQIFLALGVFSQLIKLLPKSGPWLDVVKNIFGVSMLGVFYYFLSLLIPGRYWDAALGLGFLACTVFLFRGKTKNSKLWITIGAALGLCFLAIGAFNLRPKLQERWIEEKPGYDIKATNWIHFSEAELARAREIGKPVIVDFHAEWCAACKELDQYTFTNQRFQLLSTQFVLMKFDATKESSELDALRAKYGIVGLPTVLFFDKQGKHLTELTLTSFEEADSFIRRMSKAIQ